MKSELKEEMNIENVKLKFIGKAIEPAENTPIRLTYYYVTHWDGKLKLDKCEVSKVKRLTVKQLEKLLKENPEKVAPGLKTGFPLLKKYLEKL